jgi:hypothetical protein
MEKPDGLQLTDDQVRAMMEWQMHAGYWVTSQAVALHGIAEREGLELGDDDVLRVALELFKLARDEDVQRQAAQGTMVDPVTGEEIKP